MDRDFSVFPIAKLKRNPVPVDNPAISEKDFDGILILYHVYSSTSQVKLSETLTYEVGCV